MLIQTYIKIKHLFVHMLKNLKLNFRYFTISTVMWIAANETGKDELKNGLQQKIDHRVKWKT